MGKEKYIDRTLLLFVLGFEDALIDIRLNL